MSKTLEKINQTEREYWDENKLERSKIKRLRRHAFHFSYKRQERILDKLIKKTFADKSVLELGSHEWLNWIKGKVTPKKVTCINISQAELDKGINNAKDLPFEIDFHLMDANELTFEDESFDVVYGGAILHHLDIEKTLNHVYRVLKPGGYILFLEPLNMNPVYKIYRKMNPKERTPDEHALVGADFKIIRKKFTFKHEFFDFVSVVFGFLSLKIFGDKNYGNFLNRIGYSIDVVLSKIPFLYVLFARVIIYGQKK
ncbi:class I SAM-dependent methyltransferase [Pseudotenacibaculum haliotis]|uniref:Class I SAM-dependent methyltransferase n=1 Tax=Pseudotenacibaculum haliotis TaxID=1862138 RepID=A0ABW5LTZ6_9FLAO